MHLTFCKLSKQSKNKVDDGLKIMLKGSVFCSIGYPCEKSGEHILNAFQFSAVYIAPESKNIYTRSRAIIRNIFRHQTFKEAVLDLIVRKRKRILMGSWVVISDSQIACLIQKRYRVRIVLAVVLKHTCVSVQGLVA